MVGWIIGLSIVVSALYLLGIAMFCLFESEGGSRGVDLANCFFAISWPIIVPLGLVAVLSEKMSEWWGCHKAYKRGYKDGYAGKPRAEYVNYPQWYHDGYISGREKANQADCALG